MRIYNEKNSIKYLLDVVLTTPVFSPLLKYKTQFYIWLIPSYTNNLLVYDSQTLLFINIQN